MIQTGVFINRLNNMEKRQDRHEDGCEKRHVAQEEHNKTVDARLGEGSKQLATLTANQEHVLEDLREIKAAVLNTPQKE